MTQDGDPSGTGKGGRGIFHPPNHKFEDEIRPELEVNKRGTVSMTNSETQYEASSSSLTRYTSIWTENTQSLVM